MDADRPIREIVARCVSVLVYYRNCGQSVRADEFMEADVAMIRACVAAAGLPGQEVQRQIFQPLMAELRDRYPSREAIDLHEAFLRAYLGTPVPAHS